MQTPEKCPSLTIYRPVLNVGHSEVSSVRTLAAGYGIAADKIDDSWSMPLVTSGEIRAFYEHHELSPDRENIENLLEYCTDRRPLSATHTVSVDTWPYHTYLIGQSKQSSAERIREMVTVGQMHPTTKRENATYKRLIGAYGDDYGPLSAAWIPVKYTCEVYVARARRKINAKNNLRRFMRALGQASILPQALELGPVEIKIDDTLKHD